ncbi:MAG: nucleotidyltransferase domain-containing protein [Planctomycetes bacterium]|nr:nucleotidyltransferase domain-containing protein [Planctomycetota bacterium]
MRHQTDSTGSPVLSASDVEALAQKLAAFCPEQPILLLYLHGAHAHGTQGPLSDLDLAVLLEPDRLCSHVELDLSGALEQLAGRDDVDLVVLNRAGPAIKDRVVRHGRLLYARSEAARVRFEAAAIKEALDFHYFSRVYDDELFRQLREGRVLG